MAKKAKKIEEESEDVIRIDPTVENADELHEDYDDEYEDFEDFDDDFDYDEECPGVTVSGDCAEGINVIVSKDQDGNVVKVDVQTDEEIDAMFASDDDSLPMPKYLDSTILKADATQEQIVNLCLEAKKFGFASVCVNSCWVRLCAELLRGSDVNVCTVVGFPLGAMIPEAKAFEAAAAVENGATEIDMVMNIGAMKSKDYRMVAKDIDLVAAAAHEGGAILKVIIETCLLTREEKIIACLISKIAGADFVKTSTGFSTAGATVEDVALMRSVVGDEMGVKAAGGIRTKEAAEQMIEAGASRIGTSSGAKICAD